MILVYVLVDAKINYNNIDVLLKFNSKMTYQEIFSLDGPIKGFHAKNIFSYFHHNYQTQLFQLL